MYVEMETRLLDFNDRTTTCFSKLLIVPICTSLLSSVFTCKTKEAIGELFIWLGWAYFLSHASTVRVLTENSCRTNGKMSEKKIGVKMFEL